MTICFGESGAVSHFPPCITDSDKSIQWLLSPALIIEKVASNLCKVFKQKWLNKCLQLIFIDEKQHVHQTLLTAYYLPNNTASKAASIHDMN